MKLCYEKMFCLISVFLFKRFLILFHVNATVERRFCFNKAFLLQHLQVNNLRSQRSIRNFIINHNTGDIGKKIVHLGHSWAVPHYAADGVGCVVILLCLPPCQSLNPPVVKFAQ